MNAGRDATCQPQEILLRRIMAASPEVAFAKA
jgi:hypothetical protein